MRLSLRTKQVLGVTVLVGAVVAGLSVVDLAQQAHVRLEEGEARGRLLAQAIYQRAFAIIPGAPDPYAALREDGGLRAILEASIYSKGVTYAAIVDANGIVVAHYDPEQIGQPLAEAPLLEDLVKLPAIPELREIFFGEGRTYEVREPLKIGGVAGVTRIGVSTLLVRSELQEALRPVLTTALYVLVGATFGALLLAQWLLRPIHVLRSGLQRLERGEPAATLDLPQDEFGELGREIRAVSEKLLAGREAATGPQAGLDSIVEHLADAVGIFGPSGDPLFVNPALRALLAAADRDGKRPFKHIIDRTLDTRTSAEPTTMTLPAVEGELGTRDWLVAAHPVEDRDNRLLGVMILARDLEALGEVESTIRYSRKLAALGRLTAGVAHEVKNPLNAMTIHLELLRGKLSAPVRASSGGGSAVATENRSAMEHVGVIGSEIKRLDQVVQGFLKFMRPEDLQLQPVPVPSMLSEIARIVEPDAAANGVRVQLDCAPGVPDVQGDPGSLRQALLNLALNACQAMSHGGTLRLTARGISRRRVALTVEDTGLGIHPESLPRVFDLYYTTKDGGSGIGLSMVFRTVQLHDGEIEVQSTVGTGTTFRITLPQA
jgi:signal transduction histidine kinase/HAMP domain-containing protein